MKQKIVIKVQITGNKCRSRAMKIASVAEGASKVAIEGADKDLLVVIGDGVDSVKLICSVRKKLGHATLVSVQEEKEKEKEKEKTPIQCSYIQYPHLPLYEVAYCNKNSSDCSIM